LVVFHDSPEVAGEVVLQASAGFAVGAACGVSAFGVVAAAGVVAKSVDRYDVQDAVELAVAAAVEPVAGHSTGGGR